MITLTWNEVMDAVLTLAKQLKGFKIYGIPRGGAIIAGLLSYRGCTLITTPPRDVASDKALTLIIDDIADKGTTLARWREKGFMTAALYVRGGCTPLPIFAVNTIDEDDYVLFPYEDPVKAKELENNGIYKEHG